MALPEPATILGVLNDRRPDLRESGSSLSFAELNPKREYPPRSDGRSQPSTGLSASVSSFPYADLIRELLEEGRILAARSLLEFARDLIPSDSNLVKALAPPRIRKSDRRDVDRGAEFRWLQLNGPQYKGQWVALVGGHLVASATTLSELLSELKANPALGKPLIHHLD